MNYRHSFHAGNFADVHKHVTLLAVLDYLLQKPKPLFYLDTHAGRGLYDLRHQDAERGSEWQDGIGRIFRPSCHSPLLQRYQQVIHQSQQGAGALYRYPGSPLLANQVLREIDRRVFIEKQVEECVALRKLLRQEHAPNTSIDDSDGYHALKAYLPPKEKRGLVLIDPPFEDAHEFQQLEQALLFAAERWPTGVYCLWYPLKAGGLVNTFYATLKRSALRKLLRAEFWVRPVDTPAGLNGSGMLILNPPWQLHDQLATAYAELTTLLGHNAGSERGGFRVDWLLPE